MLRIPATAGLLRRTRLLLAYNKSSGYRWSPIPKPPPAHYDRLYGVHAVLNTLRVAAAAAQQQQRNALSSAGSSDAPAEAAGKGKESREGTAEAHSSQRTALSSAAASSPHVGGPSSLHPHRGHLSCLYVRDFSLEEEEEDGSNGKRGRSAHKTVSVAGRRRRKEKVIPARYTAVRCIAALAKSLEVPIRFVPRSELVQLCGERRNQNVVLEASTYAPLEVGRLADVWRRSTDGAEDTQVEGGSDSSAPSLKSASASTRRELVLFLDRILDPTNVGGILRTAFFFGVDHVILSRDCAACTATVSRTSTGFLEHLHVHRATVPTADFLRISRMDGGDRLDVIASAVVAEPPPLAAVPRASAPSAEGTDGAAAERDDREAVEDEARTERDSGDDDGHCHRPPPAVRLLLLGNEDAGLPAELLRWCTHVAHVRSPRQLRLRQARKGGSSSTSSSGHHSTPSPDSDVHLGRVSDADNDGDVADKSLAAACGALPRHSFSEMEKREHNLQRLARVREREVSLNVNTATAALLTALVAVEGELPRCASLGVVEVHACASWRG